jgi:hypothetical protein
VLASVAVAMVASGWAYPRQLLKVLSNSKNLIGATSTNTKPFWELVSPMVTERLRVQTNNRRLAGYTKQSKYV